MPTIVKFEELPCWQLARKLTNEFYSLSSSGQMSKDYSLRDQMRRSVVSIMSNVAEGFERNGNREFIQFCYIAKASAGEFRSQLYVAHDIGYLEEDQFLLLKSLSEETSRSIGGRIRYLKSTTLKGSMYQEEEVEYEISLVLPTQYETKE